MTQARETEHAGQAALRAPARAVEAFLREYLGPAGLPPDLLAAIEYALLSPGKRLRPALAWHCCGAIGVPPGPACIAAGAAVELIHCFSLVHDDLPALDDDDLRRGRPTLHVHTSEPMAILAGDAMLTLSFRLLAECFGERSGGLVGVLSKATTQMIGGQAFDTLGGLDPGLSAREQLEVVHRGKTGALIRAACELGALVAFQALGDQGQRTGKAGLTPTDALRAITDYADALGLLFQITDDLLDVEQPAEAVGKRTGKDAAAGKVTYPSVLGVAGSRAEVARLRSGAVAALEPLGAGRQPLVDICGFVCERTR